MDPIRHYINLVEGSQSYRTQLLSTVYTQPITESMLMEDFGLSSLWDGLKKAMGGAADLVWSGIKKLASATISMLAGVPGVIVKSAVTFMIWCAFNPITSILGYVGLKNPDKAAWMIKTASETITNWVGAGASATGVAGGAATGAAIGGSVAGVPGAVGGAVLGAVGPGNIRNTIDATQRMGQGINAAGSKANITPNNLTKVIGPNSTDIARSDSDTVKNLAAAGDNSVSGETGSFRPTDSDRIKNLAAAGDNSLWGDTSNNNTIIPNGNANPIIAAGPSIAQNVQDVTPKDTGLWKSIQDAVKALNEWIGKNVSEEAIQSIADFVFTWAIPIAATAAIIYGGQLLYEYITTKEPPKLTESKVAKMIKSSLAKHKAAGDTLGGGLVTGPKKLRAHLNRNTVGAQAVPTAESMRAIINKLS